MSTKKLPESLVPLAGFLVIPVRQPPRKWGGREGTPQAPRSSSDTSIPPAGVPVSRAESSRAPRPRSPRILNLGHPRQPPAHIGPGPRAPRPHSRFPGALPRPPVGTVCRCPPCAVTLPPATRPAPPRPVPFNVRWPLCRAPAQTHHARQREGRPTSSAGQTPLSSPRIPGRAGLREKLRRCAGPWGRGGG